MEIMINWLKVSLTAVVAFIVAISVCLLIEAFGGAIGGILGSIPSTVVPGSYVILTDAGDNIDAAISGMFSFPLGSACTSCVFLPVWKILPPFYPSSMPKWLRLVTTTIVSTICWCIVGVILVWIQNWLPSIGIPIYVFSPIIVLITVICGVIFCWNPAESPKGKKKVSIWVHMTRGIVVAVFIMLSSIISGLGASDYAGLVTSFPAITAVTMISVSYSQDESVACGAIGPLMLGYVSTCLYAYISCLLFCFTNLGIWWSMLIAFFIPIIIYSIPCYYYIQWRQRVKHDHNMALRSPVNDNEKDAKIVINNIASNISPSTKSDKNIEIAVINEDVNKQNEITMRNVNTTKKE